MARGSRWTLKQEQDVRKLWDAAIPILVGVLHNPQTAPSKKIDIALAVMNKFGIAKQPDYAGTLGPAPKFVFIIGGQKREIDTATLLSQARSGATDSLEPTNGEKTNGATP